jgi:hypothetical protein
MKRKRIPLFFILYLVWAGITIVLGVHLAFESSDRKVYKGTVVNKTGNEDSAYLTVKFDSLGYRKVKVNVDTWYRNSIGNRVGFAYNKHQATGENDYLSSILAIMIAATGFFIPVAAWSASKRSRM